MQTERGCEVTWEKKETCGRICNQLYFGKKEDAAISLNGVLFGV